MNKTELIDAIIKLEWSMFTTAQNAGGRASCQDDWETFEIMRRSQHLVWAMDTLESYRADLEAARAVGMNLVAFKYAYMMRITFPEEYEAIKDRLPPVSPAKEELVEAICAVHGRWAAEKAEKYPLLSRMGRPLTSAQGGRWAAIDNYLYSELLTYSEATLRALLANIEALEAEGKDFVFMVQENTVLGQGFPTMDEAEKAMAAQFLRELNIEIGGGGCCCCGPEE